MKKSIWRQVPTQLLALSFLVAGIPLTQASEVKVEWLETDNYRDIRAPSTGQQRFEKKVLDELSEQFKRSAQAKLPAGQTLHLQITDLDLAGRIDFLYPSHTPLRIVRSIDYPRIEFSYQIKDANQNIISSGEETLKDLGFSSNSHAYSRSHSESFYYEKELIDNWFKDTF